MMSAWLIATLCSAALLAALAWHDPKRRRNRTPHPAAAARLPTNKPARRVGVLLAVVPGVVLAARGDWWDFIVWFGLSCTFGWVAAQLLAARARQ